MTPIGILLLLVSGMASAVGRRPLPLLLGVTAGMPIAVVFIGEAFDVPAFYAAAVLATFALLLGSRNQLHHGGLGWLLGFGVYAVAITVSGLFLFPDVHVLPAREGIGGALARPEPLRFTISTIAQVVYLVLGIAVVLLLRVRRATPTLAALAVTIGVLLSTAALMADTIGSPWVEGFFDNSTNVRYIDQTAAGEPRFRGIFAEPSALASFCVVGIVLMVAWLPGMSRRGRLGAALVGGGATWCLSASTAGSALSDGVLALGLLVAVGVCRLARGATLHWMTFLAGIVCLMAITPIAPTLWSLVVESVAQKTGTESFSNRFGSDLFSLHLMLETYGLGVGLGGNRPSSFLTLMLSNVGIPGTALFLVAVVQASRDAWSGATGAGDRAVVLAFWTLLLGKTIAGAALSEPLIWLFLGIMLAPKSANSVSSDTGVGVLEPQSVRADRSTSESSAFLGSALVARKEECRWRLHEFLKSRGASGVGHLAIDSITQRYLELPP